MADSGRTVRAGVIGARGIGAIHLRELARLGAQGLMIAGRSGVQELAEKLALDIGSPVSPAPSVAEMATQCEFVSVCSPNDLHLDHARTCLDAGCHVLVEKPLFWSKVVDYSFIGEIGEDCRAIFDRAGGRLAVNYPTACFAEPFFAACGLPDAIERFSFRYQSRGTYSGDAIAVDLLPHALSLLLAMRQNDELVLHERESSPNAWTASLSIGSTRCNFEFLQDPSALESVLSFNVNGQPARRIQRPSDRGFAVYLELPGVAAEPIAIENPMATCIAEAFDACKLDRPFANEPALTNAVMSLMASSLSE